MRYMKQIVTAQSPQASLFRWALIMVMAAAITLSLTMPAFAQTKYVITDGESVIVCMSSSNDPKVVIEEAGLQLGESDTYTTEKNHGISEIHINRVQMITVREGDETIVVGSYGGTVSDVLASLDLTLSASDTLSCEPDTATYDGMVIDINHDPTEIEEYEEIVPFNTYVYEDPSLEPGEEQILVEGRDGVNAVRAYVFCKNGTEIRRDILSVEALELPVDQLVLRGVDRTIRDRENSGHPLTGHGTAAVLSPVGQTVPGTNLSYTEQRDYQATAYYCPTSWRTTYTGTEAHVGTVAVDPNFIPLGTKMYIVSADGEYVYGYCTAEDIGGAIKGHIVDLFFETYDECIEFGRRDVKIYILEET